MKYGLLLLILLSSAWAQAKNIEVDFILLTKADGTGNDKWKSNGFVNSILQNSSSKIGSNISFQLNSISLLKSDKLFNIALKGNDHSILLNHMYENKLFTPGKITVLIIPYQISDDNKELIGSVSPGDMGEHNNFFFGRRPFFLMTDASDVNNISELFLRGVVSNANPSRDIQKDSKFINKFFKRLHRCHLDYQIYNECQR